MVDTHRLSEKGAQAPNPTPATTSKQGLRSCFLFYKKAITPSLLLLFAKSSSILFAIFYFKWVVFFFLVMGMSFHDRRRRSWGEEAKRVQWTMKRADEVAVVEKSSKALRRFVGHHNRAMKNPTPFKFGFANGNALVQSTN